MSDSAIESPALEDMPWEQEFKDKIASIIDKELGYDGMTDDDSDGRGLGYDDDDDPRNVFTLPEECRFLRDEEKVEDYTQGERGLFFVHPDLENPAVVICVVTLWKDKKKAEGFNNKEFKPWPFL